MDVIVVIGLIAIAVVVVLVILHKKQGQSTQQAVAATQADVMSVVSRLTDALHVANKTNQMQATVIASPPVQAVINAPASPPSLQGTPKSVVAPVPAPPTPVAPVASPVPAPVASSSPDPVPTYVPPGPPATFGVTQPELQAAARAGSASPQFAAVWAKVVAGGGDGEAMNKLLNWFQEGGGGYNPGLDERFLTDANANMTPYGLHWNGSRWA